MENIWTHRLELFVSEIGEKFFFTEEGDFNFNVEELLPESEDFSINNHPFEVTLDKISDDNVSKITGEKLTTFYVIFKTKGSPLIGLYKKLVALDFVEKLVSNCYEPGSKFFGFVYYDYKEELEHVTKHGFFSKGESLTYFIGKK